MTGGSSYPTAHSSTEQLVKGGGSWIIKENSLPARMWRLRSTSFNNQIFTTGKANILNKILFIILNQLFILFSGGYDEDSNDYLDRILLFDPDTKTFNNIAKLEQRRRDHSVSVVDMNDFICA